MEIETTPFEEKLVLDISARYDHSAVEVTLQEEDTLERASEWWYITFNNPNGLQSEMWIFKEGLRAISIHRRIQRYKLDLPSVTAPAAEADQAQTPESTSPESEASQDQGPQGEK